MKVTVAINNYNYSQFLSAYVNSTKDEMYTNIEVIMLDDCSTDTTERWLSKKWGIERFSQLIEKLTSED